MANQKLTSAPRLYVHAEPHWGGDAGRYAGRLTVEAAEQTDARHLAAVYRLLAGGDPDRLARLAAAAERIEAEDAAALDPALA